MNKSYTYIISHRSTGEFYYGSRGANTVPPEDDLWKKYFSSSKSINERRRTEGNNAFDAIVLEEFDTPEDAFISEQHLIKNHINNPLCLNRQYRTGTEGIFLTTGTKRSTSKETREKISETLRNGAHRTYKRTDEHIDILSENGKKTGGWNKGMTYTHSAPSPLKGRVSPNKGVIYDGQALSNIQNAARDPERRKRISEKLKGRVSPTKGMKFGSRTMPKDDCTHCGCPISRNNMSRHLKKCPPT